MDGMFLHYDSENQTSCLLMFHVFSFLRACLGKIRKTDDNQQRKCECNNRNVTIMLNSVAHKVIANAMAGSAAGRRALVRHTRRANDVISRLAILNGVHWHQ